MAHFFIGNVFVAKYLLSIVVGDKSTTHIATFYLESVFNKSTSDQIVVLPFEAKESTF